MGVVHTQTARAAYRQAVRPILRVTRTAAYSAEGYGVQRAEPSDERLAEGNAGSGAMGCAEFSAVDQLHDGNPRARCIPMKGRKRFAAPAAWRKLASALTALRGDGRRPNKGVEADAQNMRVAHMQTARAAYRQAVSRLLTSDTEEA